MNMAMVKAYILTWNFYMLREGNSQDYYEDERVQAMPLRFKTGGCMYIILPKTGDAVQLLSSMTTDYFTEIHTTVVTKYCSLGL